MRDDPELTRRRTLIAAGGVGASLLAGCLGRAEQSPSTDSTVDSSPTETTSAALTSAADADGAMPTATCSGGADRGMAGGLHTTEATAGETDWQSIELSRVRGDETFTIADLDAPIVVETFAVWCPTCTAQQQAMSGVDGVTRVSLNVDANEDAATVTDHAAENGFDWRYAIAPEAMTAALIEAFDAAIVHPPSSPIVVICPDGSTTYRSGSLQSADDIEALAAEC